VRRREFITLLGGAAAAWPLAARAQQPAMPVIGFLSTQTREAFAAYVTAFQNGLNAGGYVEGHNLSIQYRWAGTQYDLLPEMAKDLVRNKVSVIAAFTNVAALSAQAATGTIPIVFSIGSDPIQLNLVSNLSRPGGNITGIHFFGSALVTKRIELLQLLVPNVTPIGMLLNIHNPDSEAQLREAVFAAQTLNKSVVALEAATEKQIIEIFSQLAPRGIRALIVQTDSLFTSRPDMLAELAKRHKVPVVYPDKAQAMSGGLLSYGASIAEAFRHVGAYAARILAGERAGDLPVHQSTKVELVLNLRTAKALDLDVSPMLLARADEVIE